MHHRTKKETIINNVNSIIIANLGINSFVSIFDELKVTAQGMFDILTLNQTKLDATFPVALIDWIKIEMEAR